MHVIIKKVNYNYKLYYSSQAAVNDNTYIVNNRMTLCIYKPYKCL